VERQASWELSLSEAILFATSCRTSGKGTSLLTFPPLRTGRDTLASSGSSLSNAPLRTRLANEKTLTMDPLMAVGMKEHPIAD
jgi:hypothetical protein